MHLIFGNPAGWWALLGLPALVLIHFLQRQSRLIEVSTLFLLEREQVQSRAGRRLERWRSSRLFWWQVLAVLLLAWMLSQPRWIEAGTMQRIALVLDSTLSMEAFRQDLAAGLERDTATLDRGASRTEWLLLESELSRPPLYRGEDRAALLAALDQWKPDLGPHDVNPALRSARVAVGNDGLVFFVTDGPPNSPLPVEAHPLAYGHPLDNVGVAAALAEMRDGQPLWRVLVRNYATTAQHRTWWYESKGQRSVAQILNLEPGETTALQSAFPPGTDHIIFALEADAFPLDDRIPLVLPQPKSLTVALRGPADFFASLKPVSQMLTNTTMATGNGTADLTFTTGNSLAPLSDGSQVFFKQLADGAAKLVRAHPAPEPNSLMDELNWSGLLYQTVSPIAPRPEDATLLWDGATPLIFIRHEAQGESLVFNLDPRHSNIARLPAFALLLDRFVEETRQRKPAPERANFLAGQPLRLVLPPTARGARLEVTAVDGSINSTPATTPLTLTAAAHAHSPSPPAFFTVMVDDKVWLDGAAQFPDPRESDFRKATAIRLEAHAQTTREEAHSRPDTLTPLWLLALLGALLASWREAAKS